jgi:hypothetical protein
MSRYKSAVRHMNEARFLVFLCRMCHLHNCTREHTIANTKDRQLLQSGERADITVPPRHEQKHDLRVSPLCQAALQVGVHLNEL